MLLLAVAGVLAWVQRDDLAGLARALREAPAAVAVSLAVHAPQIVLTGLAWQALLGAPRPGAWFMTRLRWVREAANNLLPAGGLVGQALAGRALARHGVSGDMAAASATVDLTLEAASQLVFTLVGLLLLLRRTEGGAGQAAAVVTGLGLGAVALAALVAVQRGLPLAAPRRWLERRGAARAVALLDGVARAQAGARRLHAAPGRLLLGGLLHMAAWALGALEVAGVLRLLGWRVGLADGFAVESIAQALRSAGFALPGAIGVQEAGLVGACALVGVPAAPALLLALARRARELAVGAGGLAIYRGLAPARDDAHSSDERG